MTKINRKPSYGMLGKNHSIETRKKMTLNDFQNKLMEKKNGI